MDVDFQDPDLRRLEVDPRFNANLSGVLVTAYRKKMQVIRAAADERDLHKLRSLNFEKLKGGRKGQYSIRLNDQYRLVFKFGLGNPHRGKTVVILAIEDYH